MNDFLISALKVKLARKQRYGLELKSDGICSLSINKLLIKILTKFHSFQNSQYMSAQMAKFEAKISFPKYIH